MKNFTLFQIIENEQDKKIFDIIAEDYYQAFEQFTKLMICLERACETQMLYQTKYQSPVLQITSSNYGNKIQLILIQQ